jgi:hypothetical protein
MSTGNAGSIDIKANSLILKDPGSSITVEALGSKNAGGAGSLTIKSDTISLNNQAEISASVEGTGSSGDLNINSKLLNLDNSEITANSEIGQGGNIGFNIAEKLLLKNGSTISTDTKRNGNGGNISISSGFIIAYPHQGNHIKSNAEYGSGGAINIFSEEIFGITVEKYFANIENSITAISQFQPALNGTINLILPELDPSRGIYQPPEIVIDPNRLINQNACKRSTQSKFIKTGKGGLPQGIESDLSSQATQVDLINPLLNDQENKQSSKQVEINNLEDSGNIVAAQGWIIGEKGEVTLTASSQDFSRLNRTKDNVTNCQNY